MPSLIDRPHRAEVVEALETTRNSMRRYRAGSDLIVLGFVEIGLVALVILADVTWVIPTQARAAGLGLMAGLAFACLARILVGPGPKYGKHDAAIEVESAFPELGQRVRTTLEYAEPTAMTAPASASLVDATRRPDRPPDAGPGVLDACALGKLPSLGVRPGCPRGRGGGCDRQRPESGDRREAVDAQPRPLHDPRRPAGRQDGQGRLGILAQGDNRRSSGPLGRVAPASPRR